MKTTITAIALTFLSGTAAAASDRDIYRGFAKNPDLRHGNTHMHSSSMSEPGASGSPDLYSSRTTRGDIYRGFEEGNPDL